ncbi:MAG TPA: hypothetical protein VF613_10100 [Longimicrobium sp.]
MSGGRNHLRGRRVQISGSASKRTDAARVAYAHDIVRGVARQVLASGGGLVLGAGREPRTEADGPALTFDWTALEEAAAWFRGGTDAFPPHAGEPVIVVLSEKGEGEIPADRRTLWRELLATGKVHTETIQPGLRSAALLRQRQADFADILFAVGGGSGVEHSAEIFLDRRRAVLPLDLDIGASREDGTGGARRFSREARAEPERFLRAVAGAAPVSAQLAALATDGGTVPALEVVERAAQLLRDLELPRAFFVRLLNPKHADFPDIESFFRNVVDPVVAAADLRRIEMGTDASEHAFVDVGIFDSLHHAAVAVVDVTGERPNCFIELGYALGRGMRVLVTVREGSPPLPFDQAAIPTYFWSATVDDEERRRGFEIYWEKNINRPPVVR